MSPKFVMEERAHGRYTVTLDGTELSDRLTGVTIESTAGGGSHVTLTLPPSAIRVHTDATVDIDEKARELLIDLGWTPPSDDDPSPARLRRGGDNGGTAA